MRRRDPTLQELLDDATSFEIGRRWWKATQRDDGTPRATASQARQHQQQHRPQGRSGGGSCRNCAQSPACEPRQCRAKDSTCNNCGQVGHWKRANGMNLCPKLAGASSSSKKPWHGGGGSKTKSRARTAAEEAAQAPMPPPAAATSRSVCRQAAASNIPVPTLDVDLSDVTGKRILANVAATPDTGATRSIISARLLRGTSVRISKEPIHLYNASNRRMRVNGSVKLKVFSRHHNKEISVNAIVSPVMRDSMLISWHDLRSLGAVPEGFPVTSAAGAETRRATEKRDTLEAVKGSYPDVLQDTLGDSCGTIKGQPMVIELDPDAEVTPLRVSVARPIPIHMTSQANDLVKELLEAGVIVPVHEPTTWCAMGHFVPKPGGKKVRLVTDYKRLNLAVRRPVHPFSPASDLIKRIDSKSKFFARLDAVHGYFQVKLDEASSRLTTFLIPQGRFRYTCAPMGLCSSSDEFCVRTDEAVADLPYVLKIVDDLLIQAETEEQLFLRLREVLNRCREFGIKISLRKLAIGQCLKFAGFIVSSSGVSPDPEKIQALRDFPAPTNVSEMRSFLGLANQLGHFAPDLAHLTVGLRELLKKNTVYQWLPEHQTAFEKVKEMLCGNSVVQPFDPDLETELYCDASRLHGIGCALLQRTPEGRLQLVHCASQSLTAAQKNYSVVEIEATAVAWALQKCYFYLRGCPRFKVFTDHKPLVGVFAKPLAELTNARLARLREKTVDFDFEMIHTPGVDNAIADALSRRPVFAPSPCEDVEGGDVVCRRMVEDPAFEHILACAAKDRHYQRLIKAVRSDQPPTQAEFGPYRPYWHELSIEGEEPNQLVVCNGVQVVVPAEARRELLCLLHLPHCGITKTHIQVRQLYVWPGMRNDIIQLCKSCEPCQEAQPSQSKLPLQPTCASLPMEMVGIDFFEAAGKTHLLLVDRFSGYPLVHEMRTTTTEATTKRLDEWFSFLGYPAVIRSDGGPQFRGLFKDWCAERSIRHETSSPYNPNSNGLAEAAVKNVKALLLKCASSQEDFRAALLEWRNTPRADGVSPSQAFFGRRQRTKLPIFDVNKFVTLFDDVPKVRADAKDDAEIRYNNDAKSLPPLAVGEKVRMQNPLTKKWDQVGTIESVHQYGRSYNVKCDFGTMRRNRRFLRPSSEKANPSQEQMDPVKSPPPPRRSERLANKK